MRKQRGEAEHGQTQGQGQAHGFSLIELIVTVVIIGIIVAIAIPFFFGAQDSARQAAVDSAARDGHVLAEASNAYDGVITAGSVLTEVSTEDVRVVMSNSFVPGNSETICVQASWRDNDNTAISGPCGNADDIDSMFPSTPSGEFNILWDVTEDRSQRSPMSFEDSQTGLNVTIPIQGNVEGVIDWGDGTVERISSDNPSHTYETEGLYEISLEEGSFNSWVNVDRMSWTNVNVHYDLTGLQSVDVWTDTNTTSASGAFAGAVDLEYVSSPPPTLTNMENMFYHAHSFDADISGWDVSNVVSMDAMFYHAESFNQPLGSWETDSVENISHMFWGAHEFNQPIEGWDVSGVNNMEDMFREAREFNQPLNEWNTSRVRNTGHMFYGASSFNQPLDNWDMSNVRITRSMFRDSAFNHDITGWDTSMVWTMENMFTNSPFNYDISDWNVSRVEDWRNFNGGSSALEDEHVPDFRTPS